MVIGTIQFQITHPVEHNTLRRILVKPLLIGVFMPPQDMLAEATLYMTVKMTLHAEGRTLVPYGTCSSPRFRDQGISATTTFSIQ